MKIIIRLLKLVLMIAVGYVSTITLAIGQDGTPMAQPPDTKAINLGSLPGIDAIIPELATKRVIFIGEVHNRYADHLNQLDIIRRLHAIHPNLVIGMEYFQQPFQKYLDEYSAGKINDYQLLKNTEYYSRWGYDFRLYAPILHYARENHIKLVALNLPEEITSQVGLHGLESLSPEQNAQIPKSIDRSNLEYKERLQFIYHMHAHGEVGSFEHFYDVQLLWDEGMAAQAARFLKGHPNRPMVILTGDGHVQYKYGIPDRLLRRIKVSDSVVINNPGYGISPDMGDYLLLSEEHPLPIAGKLGLVLTFADDKIVVDGFSHNSVGKAAGIHKGDFLVLIDGKPINDMQAVKLTMWDKKPGQKVTLKIRRNSLFSTDDLTLNLKLGSEINHVQEMQDENK